MSYDLDDWWQTPLGDSGMELYDLIVNSLSALRDRLREEKRLDDKMQNTFKHIISVLDKEYAKLVD